MRNTAGHVFVCGEVPAEKRRPASCLEIPAGGAQILDAHLVDVDLSGIAGMAGRLSFIGSVLEGCDFTDSDLDNISLSGAVADPSARSVFRDCRFRRTKLSQTRPAHARFERCLFEDAAVQELQFRHAALVDNTFTGRVWQLVIWGRAPAHKRDASAPAHEIRGNDFSGADVAALTLRAGVDVDAQVWPAGEHYVVVDRVPERAQAVTAALGDSAQDQLTARILRWEADDFLQEKQFYRLDDPFFEAPSHQARRRMMDVQL